MPPYLAGRDHEKCEFRKLLEQNPILSNLVLTGLRGVGKTVLLDTLKPLAIQQKWLWVSQNLSEEASVSEDTTVTRLLTDLSAVSSGVSIKEEVPKVGFSTKGEFKEKTLNYIALQEMYRAVPGLVSDKLNAILEFVWKCIDGAQANINGIVFAYDEAQTMSDHAEKSQYPLSLILNVFQSLQKKGIPFMLVLVGLPTLFPKLVEARTFSERMFKVVTLKKLDEKDSRDAIVQPIHASKCPIRFDDQSVNQIIKTSGGYPYFIQFICKELYDIFLQKLSAGQKPSVPMQEIILKLDKDFFAGRWHKATDRQRELLSIIATLDSSNEEFTVQEIVAAAKAMANPFGASQVNQMLLQLTNKGLVYKNRYGKYSFAVPLLGEFILRQERETTQPLFTDKSPGLFS